MGDPQPPVFRIEVLCKTYRTGDVEVQALRGVTIDAAWTLRIEHEVGSIAAGKRADFCVLEDDPTEVGAERLKDVRVWGTVQGGRVFPAA